MQKGSLNEFLKPDTSNELPNHVYALPVRPPDEDEIVISGISGRYPESSNVNEFWTNLMSGQELVTIDDKRWPVGKSFNLNSKNISSIEFF